MKRSLRSVVPILTLGFGLGLIAACNSLIGAGAPTKVDAFGGAGGSSGADTGPACLLASDCPDQQICLFQTCSKPCAADKDCQLGRCLQTQAGTACVVPASTSCTTDDQCPAGSQCKDAFCRTACTSDADCLSDQSCVNDACVHNPGSPGEAGAGGASGSEGTGGSVGTSGNGGSSGSGGSGGGVLMDGTALGSLGVTCDKNGAFACVGHAQRGQLVCLNGTWQSNGTCAGSMLCDTTLGANQGSCQPIVPECKDQMAGTHFCRGTETDLRQCGVDLVTATVVDSCKYVCTAGACAGQCHPGDKQCKTGGLIPQLCDDAGMWADQTQCGYQCDGTTGKCIAAGCKDGVLNGDETAKDCGGSCGGCAVGATCKIDGDCLAPASAHCSNGICAAATCTDGVQNGDETDKDCGGSCAADCAVGQGCMGNGDCALPLSGHCSNSKCIAAACNDGVQNGSETDKDCGGSCAADCVTGSSCAGDADCASGVCLTSKCVTCRPTTKQCVNTSVQTCSGTGDWGNSVACTVANGVPNCTGNGVCGIASCSPGYGDCDLNVTNGCEANLHIAGACGTTCGNRIACSASNGTPSCPNGSCVMACNPGFGDCSQTTNDGCETNLNVAANCGTCAHTAQCTVPAQICSAGSCVTNTPYNLGDSSSSGFTPFDPANNKWYVVRVTASKTATVSGFRLLGSAAGPGIARMALWTENASGQPGAFLAQSTGSSIPVALGLDSDTATPGGVQLTAGKNYWVGAEFTASPAPNTAHIYYNTVAGRTVYTFDQTFGNVPANTLAPFPAASAGTLTDLALNFFLLVQDVPP